MGCCGQKRVQLSSATAPVTNGAVTRQSPANHSAPDRETSPAYSSVSILYLEKSPILVRGPVTGRNYEFSSACRVQVVHPSDAEALLRTRFFRRN